MFDSSYVVHTSSGMCGDRLCGVQEVAETQEKAGLKEECIEFYDKACSPPQITPQ